MTTQASVVAGRDQFDRGDDWLNSPDKEPGERRELDVGHTEDRLHYWWSATVWKRNGDEWHRRQVTSTDADCASALRAVLDSIGAPP